ncbi:pyridoxamine 5'-phosphate oxidase family protein [Pseudovibrio sp. FO-BEG1]|uniref:pyridoxamine 5'-phosphate oxidase family protein n=1 Tax=Pseudovibrio sp. (strain FO-BEG1) TaxID=911045 RepID=UPI000238D09D|nr:pyridoxamine 5'-phosphate oxidase family protein [Pseudovibrio sp. FO-BEG1]AEV39281.1 pyridoxamine 5'-phosphate oxidase family protein [Pseudovibrio sp. FO-BEG1]
MQDADLKSVSHEITSLEQLEELYGSPKQISIDKEVGYISEHYKTFIEASPFFALSTVAEEGTDCSPRGDPAGFVKVIDEKTIEFADRRGNNRIDSLRNIVRDPRVSLLFMIPGIGETVRINGKASISTDPARLEAHMMEGKLPKSIITVTVDTIYFQCQKAIYRSGLWTEEAKVDRKSIPSAGQMAQSLSKVEFDGAAYDKAYPARLKETAY